MELLVSLIVCLIIGATIGFFGSAMVFGYVTRARVNRLIRSGQLTTADARRLLEIFYR